jgi:hypothetical protein
MFKNNLKKIILKKIKKYLNLIKTSDYKHGVKNFVQWCLNEYKVNV